MPRNARIVEVGVLALLLAGCAAAPEAPYNPVAEYGSGSPIPDGLDYIGAVQCGALLTAVSDVTFDRFSNISYYSQAGLFREWAELKAVEAGKDPRLALADMKASRDDFLAAPGRMTQAERRLAILKAHSGDIRACSSMSDAASFDLIIVGG